MTPTGRWSKPKRPSRSTAAVLLVLAGVLAACAPPAGRLNLTPVNFSALAGWGEDSPKDAIAAFLRSCARLAPTNPGRRVGPKDIGARAADWKAPCAAAETLDGKDGRVAREFFEAHFVPFEAADGADTEGLFTGYYEAELRGSKTASARYSIPIYGRPDDLVTVDLGEFRSDLRGRRVAGRIVSGRLRPFPDRARIEGSTRSVKARPIVWVDSAIDAFFLHIQGSGRVILADGSIIRVGYAAQNGHPYSSIGALLIRSGDATREEMSMQWLRAWLRDNPRKARRLMAKNRSYVFFRVLKGPGPIGAEGVALTPGRSLAVDRKFLPFGIPVWLDIAELPRGSGRPPTRLRRLMVAQDTGGAIKGPVRGDVFWGFGAKAADRAGAMRAQGRYFLLLPRATAKRLRARAGQS